MKLFAEYVEAIVCGLVFLFYHPAALQNQWELLLKNLNVCLHWVLGVLFLLYLFEICLDICQIIVYIDILFYM